MALEGIQLLSALSGLDTLLHSVVLALPCQTLILVTNETMLSPASSRLLDSGRRLDTNALKPSMFIQALVGRNEKTQA